MVFAVAPEIETEAKVEQRKSIFEVTPVIKDSLTTDNERGEVIESGAVEESAESTEPAASLPTGLVERQPQLSDDFSSVQDFMDTGNSARLVVLTAPTWCAPCRDYEAVINKFNHSESFDADIQVIDIDKYPRLYQLLKGRNSVPQTLSLEGEDISRVYGPMTKKWIEDKLNPPAKAAKAVVQPQKFWCTTHQRWEQR